MFLLVVRARYDCFHDEGERSPEAAARRSCPGDLPKVKVYAGIDSIIKKQHYLSGPSSAAARPLEKC
ncbi:hypothetical protein ACTFTM_25040 [Micromonospora sp. RB23]